MLHFFQSEAFILNRSIEFQSSGDFQGNRLHKSLDTGADIVASLLGFETPMFRILYHLFQ